MSFDYIERMYGVKFFRGQEVMALGEKGTVASATNHVFVRLEGKKDSRPYHPTDVKPIEGDRNAN